jgi:long-chain fatty acid transport protein
LREPSDFFINQKSGGKMKKLLTIALLVFTHTLLNAGGFQVNEHGSRAMGMGGAFIAVASDPSAIYFNPAGLSQLKGLKVMMGATFIAPRTTF